MEQNQSLQEKTAEYIRTVRVATYEVGAQAVLSLGTLLRYCQETSERHLDLLGLSYEKMKRDGLVFLIISNRPKISRMPKRGEEVTIKTHPRGTLGAQFYRDFKLYVGDEPVAEMMQTSVAADPATHKILRPKQFLQYGIFTDEKMDAENKMARTVVPEGMPFVGERKIYYSDLDPNQHLHNTIYGDILTDFLPGGIAGKSFRSAQINYIMESALGETLKIYALEKDGKILMRGDNERGCSFTAEAELAPLK